MKANKRIMLCLTAGFALLCLVQAPDVRANMEMPEQQPSCASATPVKIWLTNLNIKGERWTGGDFLREEKFGGFECNVVNRDCHDQQARRNEIVRWNQSREELLRRGDTNKASIYVEKPLPTFPPCALKIDSAVTNWMLNPSVKIYRVAGIREGKRVRGEGWTVEELGGKSALWLDGTGTPPALLGSVPLILRGILDKTVTDRLANGEYELEVSLDTKKATDLNVADTGMITSSFFFRIKSPENDGEKWWLERKKFHAAREKSDWKTVLSLANDALERYQSAEIIYRLWWYKGAAFQKMGKDEEALASYEEAWKRRWKGMEPHNEWPVTEPMFELRRKLNKLPEQK